MQPVYAYEHKRAVILLQENARNAKVALRTHEQLSGISETEKWIKPVLFSLFRRLIPIQNCQILGIILVSFYASN